jgi:glycosyltransferase involved in cell wall biosynthesis
VKIGIYNESSSGGIGGSEISVAVLAEALKDGHHVEIIHNKESLSLDVLAAISGTNLDDVRMRHVEYEPYSFGNSHNPFKRYHKARAWQAALSEPYDLFINFTHNIPPFCYAAKGALLILFPLDEAMHVQLRAEGASAGMSDFSRLIKRSYHGWEWRRRLESYQIAISISHFTREWTKRRWDIDSQVIYPPVDMKFRAGDKSETILSVGRFTTMGHSKKQLEMMATFDQLDDDCLSGWRYTSVGGLSNSPQDQEYFEQVQRAAQNSRARVAANIERDYLKRLYAEAKVFWHAAGYGEDDSQRPELTEHFGIVTVEAMAAKCVPVVINKGGQPEIVEHGFNGFLWNTLEELKEYTRMVARDERLRAQMAEAASIRARSFSREEFVTRFLRALKL